MQDESTVVPEGQEQPSGDTSVEATEGTEKAWTLPEEHAKAPWAENIKSEADIYAKLNEMHAAASKEQAPSFEVPEEPTAYEVGEFFDKEVVADVQQIFHKAGLSKEQAASVAKEYAAFEKANQDKLFGEAGFKEELATFFKGDEAAMKNTAMALAKSLPTEDKALLDSMPNPVVGLVYRAAASLIKSYGITDTGAAQGQERSAPLTPEDRRVEAGKLYNRIDEAKASGNFAEVERLKNEVNKLYSGK